jgi:hypothetical protein
VDGSEALGRGSSSIPSATFRRIHHQSARQASSAGAMNCSERMRGIAVKPATRSTVPTQHTEQVLQSGALSPRVRQNSNCDVLS